MGNGVIIKRNNTSDFRLTSILFLFHMLLAGISSVSGQPKYEIILTVQKGINFGEFYPTYGGTVTIDSTGTRSANGGIVLLPGGLFHQCVVNVNVDRNNRPINILVENSIKISRTSGGDMTLNLVAFPLSYTSSNQNPNKLINIWGTLTVGNIMSNPPGNYNGSFTITVNGN